MVPPFVSQGNSLPFPTTSDIVYCLCVKAEVPYATTVCTPTLPYEEEKPHWQSIVKSAHKYSSVVMQYTNPCNLLMMTCIWLSNAVINTSPLTLEDARAPSYLTDWNKLTLIVRITTLQLHHPLHKLYHSSGSHTFSAKHCTSDMFQKTSSLDQMSFMTHSCMCHEPLGGEWYSGFYLIPHTMR